jgi:hypothetical protein
MSGHLTSKEIARWLVEGPAAGAEAHTSHCWHCQERLAKAVEPLAIFRVGLVEWSERQPFVPFLANERQPFRRKSESRDWSHFMNWIPAFGLAVALAVLAGVLVELPAFHPHAIPAQVSNTATADSALMDQVDEDVSETVPDAMAPLTDLVAWDPETTPEETLAGKQTNKARAATNVRLKTTD